MSKIEFEISRLVPRFLYKDKNGYAISKAIERAFQYVAQKVEEGIATIQDPEQMPEWRLDEIAGEYGIIYDYSADISTKRGWIADAIQFYSLYGTPTGIVKYLEAAFDTVNLEEWWQYGGEPFHFRVIVTGEWSEANDEWAKKAIEEAKNVRSVLDNIIFNAGSSSAPFGVGAASLGVEIVETCQML